jgi:ubiquinone/menaquinone biosynthesis C-methylase UbiE
MKQREVGLGFPAKWLELGRKYMWREEFLPLLFQYLELSPGQNVVDVGCGTGFFTRIVARGLKGRGKSWVWTRMLIFLGLRRN